MKAALIGEKLGHSYSKWIHEISFEKQGIVASYDLLEISKEDLKNKGKSILSLYDGYNVTIPYKVEILSHIDVISEEAKRIGAVNTLVKKGKQWMGKNTDYFGFSKLLESIDINLKDKEAVVLGTGGASRAVITCLADKGCSSIYVVSRFPSSVDASMLSFLEQEKAVLCDYKKLSSLQAELLVNTTPVGMFPHNEKMPIESKIIDSFNVVIDIIYNPIETTLLLEAKKQGKKTANGLMMLIYQALKAEECWLGREIEEEKCKEIIVCIENQLQKIYSL